MLNLPKGVAMEVSRVALCSLQLAQCSSAGLFMPYQSRKHASSSKLRSRDVASFYKSNPNVVLSSWQAFSNMISYKKITYSLV